MKKPFSIKKSGIFVLTFILIFAIVNISLAASLGVNTKNISTTTIPSATVNTKTITTTPATTTPIIIPTKTITPDPLIITPKTATETNIKSQTTDSQNVTTPTVSTTLEKKAINPQPEPPKPVTQTITTAPAVSTTLDKKAINPQPEPPKTKTTNSTSSQAQIIDPQPPGSYSGTELVGKFAQCLGYVNKYIQIDDEVTWNKIDDEVTWQTCANYYTPIVGSDFVSKLNKCISGIQNKVKIDDEVTWNACKQQLKDLKFTSKGSLSAFAPQPSSNTSANKLSPQPDPPGKTIKPNITTVYSYDLSGIKSDTGKSYAYNKILTVNREIILDKSTGKKTPLDELRINLSSALDKKTLDKIKIATVQPADVITEDTSKSSNITLGIKEEGNKLHYKMELDGKKEDIYKSSAKGTEKVITLPDDKPIKFEVSKNLISISDKYDVDYSDLKKANKQFYFDLPFQASDVAKARHYDTTLQNDCIKVFIDKDKKKSIDICEDLKLDKGSEKLVKNGKDYSLSKSPDLIYDAADKTAGKNNAIIGSAKLAVKGDKPIYSFDITEKHKFLGFIPINVQAEVQFDPDLEKMTGIDYNWLGFLFQNKIYDIDLNIGPNLVIEKVELTPQSVHTGDKLTFIATVKNTGNQHAGAYYTTPAGPSSVDLYFGDDLKIKSAETGFFLFPGDSIKFYLEWSAALCNVPVTIKVDPKNIVKETNENDNNWQYNVKCALTNAPDLVVKSTSFNGNTKRVGAQNTYNITLGNDGTQLSPGFTSILNYEGISTNIVPPPMLAGGTWSTSRVITPQSCTGSILTLDYANTVNEYSENNNIGYEPGDVLLTCNRRPDLFVKNVWWKAGGGYSFGTPYPGEQMWFEFTIKNTPIDYFANNACLSGFKVALKLNGQVIQNFNMPKIGCVPAYGSSHPDYWTEIGHFNYTAKCNGEHLTLEVDPDNSISESLENNNIWSYDVVCQLPPPVVTPS